MRVSANDRAIRGLRPASKQYEIRVSGHRGLILWVHPSGTKTFAYRFRLGGVLHRVKLGNYPECGLATALQKYAAVQGRRRQGISPAIKAPSTHGGSGALTIGELASEYIERYAKPNKRSWQKDQQMLDADVLPAWKRRKASAITKRDVVTLLDTVMDRGAGRQAGKILALVRKLFAYGVSRDVISDNPAQGIPLPVKQLARDRTLSDSELAVFWSKLPGLGESVLRPAVRDALLIQLLTGQRLGEVLRLEWSEIDRRAKTWLIPSSKAKNGRESLVPLTAPIIAILDRQPAGEGFVFPVRGKLGYIRTEVAAHELVGAVDALKMAKFTSHDLRRTCATKLAELGTSRVVVDSILNHTDKSVTAVYDRHTYMPEKRAALDSWSGFLTRLKLPLTVEN